MYHIIPFIYFNLFRCLQTLQTKLQRISVNGRTEYSSWNLSNGKLLRTQCPVWVPLPDDVGTPQPIEAPRLGWLLTASSQHLVRAGLWKALKAIITQSSHPVKRIKYNSKLNYLKVNQLYEELPSAEKLDVIRERTTGLQRHAQRQWDSFAITAPWQTVSKRRCDWSPILLLGLIGRLSDWRRSNDSHD